MAIKLKDAVAVVKKEIRKWRERYEAVENEKQARPPNYSRGLNYGRLFLSAYSESSRSR